MSEQITTTRTLEVVAAEIRTFTASMLNTIIEIGRRLVEAKAMLPYGKFGEWVETQTGYSHSTANNFMRIFDEYGSRQGSLFGDLEDPQTFGKLSYSKALSLLALPAPERAEFIQTHDVEEMSTRELQAAIRERDEALKRAEAAEKRIGEIDEYVEKSNRNVDRAEKETLRYEKENQALKKQIAELESRPVEVAVKVDEEAAKKAAADAKTAADEAWKKKTDALQKKLDAAEKKAEAAEKKTKAAEEAAKKADAAGAEEARAEAARIGAEAEALRAETARLKKELAMSGAAMTAFKLHFSAWQKAYADMCAALEQMDAETAGKMRGALAAQLRGWLEKG